MLMKLGMSLFRYLLTPIIILVIFTTSTSYAKKAAIVIDFDTKEVLFEVNANTKLSSFINKNYDTIYFV